MVIGKRQQNLPRQQGADQGDVRLVISALWMTKKLCSGKRVRVLDLDCIERVIVAAWTIVIRIIASPFRDHV